MFVNPLPSPATAFAAFQKCIERISPTGGIIWFKLAHNNFFTGEANPSGKFGIWTTSGSGTDRRRTDFIPDAYASLSELARKREGGVFYIPGMPREFPLKDYCFEVADIGAEMDDGTNKEQWQRIQWFAEVSDLVPGLVINSGGKSEHPHWFLDEPVPIETATYLKKLLAIILLSDPAVVSPHQPMRIAGFYRQEKGKEQTLDFWSDNRYTQTQFLQGIKAAYQAKDFAFPKRLSDERWRRLRQVLTNKELSLSAKSSQIREILALDESALYPQPKQYKTEGKFQYSGDRIPLEICLTKDDRDLIARGVGEGSRTNSGYKLAVNLVGTAGALDRLGIAYSPEPRQLFDEYISRCSPPLPNREVETIWRSAGRGNPKASLTDEAILNCVGAWQWKQQNPQSVAKSRGHQVPERRTGHRFEDFLSSGLFKLRQQLSKATEIRNFWGFGRKGEAQVEPTPKSAAPAIEYQPGERLDVWAEASKQGEKYVLDSGATGSGKSFDAGMATSELFEVSQLIYASNEHRNPSAPTLAPWPDLEARHKGLSRDKFGKLRRVKPGQPYIVPPNCGRVDTIGALRNKNIAGADTAEEICSSCKFLEQCRAGATYDYLALRAETLSQSRLRAHPASLPDPIDYDYSSVVIVWEEASEILKAHHSIEVSEQDLSATVAQLALKLPDDFDTLRPLLSNLDDYLSGQHKQPNKFGWSDGQVRELLPNLEGVDVSAIALALQPDLASILNPTAEYGVDMANLRRNEREMFSESDETTAAQVQQKVLLNWLPDLLNILLGNTNGSLRIQNGILTISVAEERLATIARAAKVNIFLDATGDSEDLARVLGVDPAEILTVRQVMPDASNLEVVQVATVGRLGIGSRRKDKNGDDTFLQKRIDALITQIQQDAPGKVATIDFKRHTTDGDGKRHWWVDSRGVNDLEDCDVLILVGVPCRNLADLEAEFSVLSRRAPSPGTERVKYPIQVKGTPSDDLQPWFEMEVSADPEFRAFVRRRILADLHQAIGRLRAHRRPGQQLKVYFVADYPLDIPVTLKRASDITPEAATKVERVEMAIKAAVQQLKDAGLKITQAAIAQLTGYSQQYISRFRVLLQTLVSPFNSKSSKNSDSPPDPPPDPEEFELMSNQYLPMLADAPLGELLEGVLATLEVYGYVVWQQIWDATPAPVQVKILTALMFTLSAAELQLLGIAVGVKV